MNSLMSCVVGGWWGVPACQHASRHSRHDERGNKGVAQADQQRRAARKRTAVGSCASKYSSWLTTASAVKSSTWHSHEEKEEHRLSAHSLFRRLVRLWPKRGAWLIGFLPVTLCVRRACVPRKTMRCRMSSAMGSVGPPASMKRGVMGGASALAPPARLCPAPAPAHGTHSSLWALSGVRPARGNNTRLRDAGRHRAWRVEEEEGSDKGVEVHHSSAAHERTARTRATGGAPTHRLDIAPAKGFKWRLPAWQ